MGGRRGVDPPVKLPNRYMVSKVKRAHPGDGVLLIRFPRYSAQQAAAAALWRWVDLSGGGPEECC